MLSVTPKRPSEIQSHKFIFYKKAENFEKIQTFVILKKVIKSWSRSEVINWSRNDGREVRSRSDSDSCLSLIHVCFSFLLIVSLINVQFIRNAKT